MEASPGPSAARAQPAPAAPRSERALALLALGGPVEVLARLAAGDPLGLVPRARSRARERWLLLDPERVRTRVLAVAARRAALYRGRPPLERWLGECVDEALDGLAGERGGNCLPGPVEPAALQRFHRLPACAREAFCRVVLVGESPEDLAVELGVNLSEVGRRARRAIDALLPPAAPAPGGAR